jgi:imidazolonepropionase-like amidohydrolase
MTLLLRNLTYVDPVARCLVPDVAIAAQDGRIEAMGPDAAVDGALDAGGRFLVPGLMDMHIHLRPRSHQGPTTDRPVTTMVGDVADREGLVSRLHSFLYSGVTSVYDAGNDAGMILALREEERAGRLLAPRIFCTGSLLTCPGGHGSAMAVEIASLPADLPRLDAYLAREPDVVKVTYDEHGWGVRPLIPILDVPTFRGIVDRSHAARRRVTVHVSNELRAREAVACGADALAHPVIQSPLTDEFTWLLAAKGVPVVSTLAIGERYSRLADHPEFLDEPPYRACLHEAERHHLATEESERQRSNRWAAWMKIMTPVAQDNLRRLVEAGGVMVTGTDLSLGPDYHRELRLLQDAGIAPIEIIRAATCHAARFLGRERELGALTVGARADFLVVDRDPTADVGRLAEIWMVVKDGRQVDRARLSLPGVAAAPS